MPKIDVDYQNTIIYGIFNTMNPSIYYVGMTTNLCKRKAQHKYYSNIVDENNKKYNYPLYATIRANGGWDAFTMNVIEIYPCNSRLEASARENYYFHLYNANMNNNEPNSSKKASLANYRDNHKEEIQLYRDNRKEETQIYNKLYKAKKKLELLDNIIIK